MMLRLHLLLAFLSAALFAQSAPTLAVDANANRHPISPFIYGVNEWSDSGLYGIMHVPVVRWGGDDATSYNWQVSVKNNTGDNPWCYENYSVSPGFDGFHNANLMAGTVSLGTIPLMDWLPKAAGACSFSVQKYGAQKATAPDDSDCGNGVLTNGNLVVSLPNYTPNDAYVPVTTSFAQYWIQHIMSSYGPANAGGVRIWSMDNEPEWWYSNHQDVYPQAASYDDMLARNLKWAQAVKSTDPTALVTGPVPGGWSGMLFSRVDMDSGWGTSPYQYWDNPTDQKAHGGVPWVPYYLQQMSQFEQANGIRLLDYLDVHAYITPSGLSGSAGDAAMETLRMTSTRALWDPNYLVPGGGYEDATGAEVAPHLIPQMQQWISANYPGTNTAITEYSWGAIDTITGAIAQADILGIFGAYGLGMGTLWGTPAPTDPGAFAFKIFLNYDGNGNQFGSTGVSAVSSDPDTLAIYAAQRVDSALTILVLNKTTSAISDAISLANFTPAGTAQVWQYSQANLGAIVGQTSGINVSGGSLNATFPAYSMTLLVIPQAQSAMTVPQPVISSVTSAASYDASGVSPGEIVAIFGQGLGPASFTSLQVNPNQTLSTSIGGVEVFFNGYPAAMVYALAGQLSAIVPYELAGQSSAQVVVVYQGNASAPFQVAMAGSKPGIFTNDASGQGQGAILNLDYSRNGPANPVARGGYIFIYGTGEGVTTPPGLDGRISATPLPKVNLQCSATVGGESATVSYCGEAPGSTAGLVQVNVQIPDSVTPGSAVPVSIKIGLGASQSGVTVAVK